MGWTRICFGWCMATISVHSLAMTGNIPRSGTWQSLLLGHGVSSGKIAKARTDYPSLLRSPKRIRDAQGQPVRQQSLNVSFINHNTSIPHYAYVIGIMANDTPVALTTNGDWLEPGTNLTFTPRPLDANITFILNGDEMWPTITVSSSLASGRVYVSDAELTIAEVHTDQGPAFVLPDGTNPNDQSGDIAWSYVEFTKTDIGTFADLSFVDFISLPLALELQSATGESQVAPGINSSAISLVCDGLKVYAEQESQPWDQLCQMDKYGNLVRVVAPGKYMAIHPEAFPKYYDEYLQMSAQRFTVDTPLYIQDPQNTANLISCYADGASWTCAGANRVLSISAPQDIFSCSGAFDLLPTDNYVLKIVIPRLCAALQRTTLLLDGGDVQPNLTPNTYYAASPTNRYAQLVHEVELDGKGYAFPYDDVRSYNSTDTSGTLYMSDATSLIITVGGA